MELIKKDVFEYGISAVGVDGDGGLLAEVAMYNGNQSHVDYGKQIGERVVVKLHRESDGKLLTVNASEFGIS